MIYNHQNQIKNSGQIISCVWVLQTKFIVKQEIVWVNCSRDFDMIKFYLWAERLFLLTKISNTKLINTLNKCGLFVWDEFNSVGTNNLHNCAFPQKLVEDFRSFFWWWYYCCCCKKVG
jgi:hypothetical protein